MRDARSWVDLWRENHIQSYYTLHFARVLIPAQCLFTLCQAGTVPWICVCNTLCFVAINIFYWSGFKWSCSVSYTDWVLQASLFKHKMFSVFPTKFTAQDVLFWNLSLINFPPKFQFLSSSVTTVGLWLFLIPSVHISYPRDGVRWFASWVYRMCILFLLDRKQKSFLKDGLELLFLTL